MKLVRDISVTSGALRIGPAFSPARLFAADEPGLWLDPSDLTTLFQDSAGTTPVTAPGDPVSIALDKSQNLTVGSELITNGDFADGSTGWTINAAGANTISVANGAFTLTATGSADTATITHAWLGAAANGKTYEISFEVLTGSSGTIKISALGINNTIGEHSFSATVGVKTFRLVANTSAVIGFSRVSGAVATAIITNISVKEIAGNHARQTTTASRPTYGVVPFGGRRNLLTYSEQFDNAAWGATDTATVTANAIAAPDGTITADRLTANATTFGSRGQTITLALATVYTVSVYIKADTSTRGAVSLYDFTGVDNQGMVNFNWTAGVPSTQSTTGSPTNITYTNVGDGWYRLSFTATSDAVNGGHRVLMYPDRALGTAAMYFWGAQVELGSAATAYQKVVSQYDVTEVGTVSLSYLSFDGVDDFLVTPTITPGTDKVQVFAGVRKLSDAAQGMAAESSVSSSANNGAFYLIAPNASERTYDFRSKGTVAAEAFTLSASYAAPVTNVLTGLGDIAGDSAILRVNGAVVDTETGDQGTGNYLAYPIYIGRRGGTTLPFSGQLYGMITRFGAVPSGQQVTLAERWINARTGAF